MSAITVFSRTALFAALMCGACSAWGASFKLSNVSKVKVGMTKAEVSVLGKPSQTVPRAPGAGGDEAWVWVDRGAFKSKTVSIIFTSNKVSQVPPRGE